MVIKERCESEELLLFRQLYLRMELSEKDKQHYFNLEKGYEGELAFDHMIDHQRSNCLILNDLLLEINNSLFQLDKVLIAPEKVYIYEVKNFEGDYYFESDRWFTLGKTEIKDPLLQLKRSDSSLRRLLKQIGFNCTIDSHLIFVNPEFHLYNSPIHQPIIYPTQINRHIYDFKLNSSLKLNNNHFKLAEKLLDLHISKNPYSLVPKYQYDDIKKGIVCPTCGSFYSGMKEAHLLSCGKCGFKETVESGVLRSVGEFALLFPDVRITKNIVWDWCRIVSSKYIIQRILMDNFKVVGAGKALHYIKKI
ncbi:NERD domain-containing protein [Anaerobacillus alkaliphilus]|uniref:NERD domain-containing protein n=1 Tax=Anaerobacillus alkaliphilus TaxID=1548597 RepID=A0A4Q0VWC7_9BACI|nr:nuclease-related domain-containing protein [Anaerobacillus alkaliphilus]RXJ03037.1 NERD domain-containing protein [Anaerobacillus alkaliphilus]